MTLLPLQKREKKKEKEKKVMTFMSESPYFGSCQDVETREYVK